MDKNNKEPTLEELCATLRSDDYLKKVAGIVKNEHGDANAEQKIKEGFIDPMINEFCSNKKENIRTK